MLNLIKQRSPLIILTFTTSGCFGKGNSSKEKIMKFFQIGKKGIFRMRGKKKRFSLN